jgi:hypothetical protein
MSRIRRALAAAAMALAAAGGGLVAASGAVPAYASAPAITAPPPGSSTVTITAHATAPAAGKAGSTVLPCATASGASCVPQTITCWITVPPPYVLMQVIAATTSVHCDSQVDAINLDQTLSEGSEIVEVKSDHKVNDTDAFTIAGDGNCQGGLEYDNFGFATIDFPPGYTPVYPPGYLHHLESYVPTASACAPPGTPIITCATAPPPAPSTQSTPAVAPSSAEPDGPGPRLHTC